MIDPLRHLSVFSPDAFGQQRVDVIGCGATGSRIVLSLAKLGIQNIHAWDFDTISEVNIANQMFGPDCVGLKKVEVLRLFVFSQTGARIVAHDERVDGTQQLGQVVFLLTDTMASRKEIWGGALKLKLRTNLMIETRMGADSGRIYTVNPNNLAQIKAWEGTLYTDEEAADATTTACRASVSVGPTAEVISGLAVWQFMRWFSIEQGNQDDALENEILFGLRPMTVVLSQKFPTRCAA